MILKGAFLLMDPAILFRKWASSWPIMNVGVLPMSMDDPPKDPFMMKVAVSAGLLARLVCMTLSNGTIVIGPKKRNLIICRGRPRLSVTLAIDSDEAPAVSM